MKTLRALALITLVALLTITQPEAWAKRMGGGASIGKQSGNVTQRQGNAAQPASAPQQANRQNTPAQQPAQPARRPWGAMLGGLAAGLGLAWLANSLGLGAAFANILLLGLLAVVAMAVVGFVLRARAARSAALSGATPGPVAATIGGPALSTADGPNVRTIQQYNPARVGNDASARPWEQDGAPATSPQDSSMIGAGLADSATAGWHTPEGFDVPGFEAAARQNFITLQAAWDKGDIPTLRAMMTDAMLDEIRQQLAEREAQANGQPNQTDVITLEAQFLGIEEQADAWMASVEFSGLIREDASVGPAPFREVWNMLKPRNNSSGWLVAGLQAMD